jgi:predicted GNAT family N-acyltransferase
MKFKVIKYNTPEYAQAVALREEILRKPLGIGFTDEEIAAEKDWIHIAAYQNSKLCATAALVYENSALAKICRVAVLAELQGKGIGIEIMRYTESYAAQQGFKEIYLHARDTSVPFYIKNQYIAEGDWFYEDTVPHKKLRKFLGNSEEVCTSYEKIVDWYDNARTKTLMEKEYLELCLKNRKRLIKRT